MNRTPHLRLLAHGSVGGALLSCLRAPLGLDWTQVPAVEGVTAGLFRAAALLALALGLRADRAAFRDGLGGTWFTGLALGFAAHAFHAPPWLEPAGRLTAVALLVLGTLALRALAGPLSGPGAGPGATGGEADPQAPVGRPGGRPGDRMERAGLVAIGIGLSLALEALARELRQFAPVPDGESVLAATFLLLLLAAVVSFGPLLRRLGPERLRCAGGSALAAGSTLAGLAYLALLTPDGLHAYLRRFDALTSGVRTLDARLGGPLGLEAIPTLGSGSIGTLWTTALLAAATTVVPAFVLGGTLGATRHVGRLRHLLVGSALGLVLEPHLVRALARPLAGEALHTAAWAWTWTLAGASLAAAGVLLVGLGERRGRGLGLLLAVLAAGLPWIRPRLIVWSFSPWAVAPISPELVVQTPAGMVTLERDREGTPIVTLDRRRMSPTAEEFELDGRRIRLSFGLLPAELRQGPVRALFVGQLTPSRARALRGLGALDLDRTVPWHEAAAALEERLFAGEEPPPGRSVSPAQARARLSAGEYDWVLVAPVQGPVLHWRSEARELWGSAEAPRLDRLRLESGIGVAWVPADSPFARLAPRGQVLPAMARFEKLALGLVIGSVDSPEAGAQLLLATGAPVKHPTRLAALRTLPQLRSLAYEAASARRLAEAAATRADDPVRAALTRGLERHFAAQGFSSPFESRAQQIEVDEGSLRAFSAAARESAALDPFQRELWEGLAWLTTEKRLPEEALVYLEPVAERFQPWPALDEAVGNAYLEVLEPEDALRCFERASTAGQNLELFGRMAALAQELGQEQRAQEYWKRGLELQPGRPDFQRGYGLSLLRSGAPRGPEVLEEYLRRFPEDEEVRQALDGPPRD